MKKFFTAVLLVIICFVCSASGVFEQVPADSSVICRFDIGAVLVRPEVNKMLNTRESLETQLEFAKKAGCSISDITEAVIAIWGDNRTAVLLKLNKNVDVDAAVKKFQAADKKLAGKAAYYAINSGAVSQIAGDVVVFASPEDMTAFLASAKGLPAQLKQLSAGFDAPKAPIAWMVFGGKGIKFSGSASYNFAGKNGLDHVISADIVFRKEKEAQQFAALAPMYSGMFSGMLFGADPNLGAEVVKNFRVSDFGKTVRLSIYLPAALVDRITAYAQVQGPKQLKQIEPSTLPATTKE